jgi:hypothetical protein
MPTSPPVVKKTDLPVFSASGPIPFASQTDVEGAQGVAAEGKKDDSDIWEIPDTPAK